MAVVAITVSGLAGPLCVVSIEAKATLGELKAAVEVASGIPAVGQCLILGVRELRSIGDLPASASQADLQLLRRSQEHVQCLERLAQCSGLDVAGLHMEAVAGCLDHSSEDVRCAACEAFAVGCFGGADAAALLQALAGLLHDESWRVRVAACAALGSQGEAASCHMPAMADCLADDDPDVQMAACMALNRNAAEGSRHNLAFLVSRYLENASAGAREGAVTVLGNLGEAGAPHLAALAERLNDPIFSVRRAACTALGKHGAAATPHALPLVVCLGDAYRDVREAASAALVLHAQVLDEEARAELAAVLAKHLGDCSQHVRQGVCEVFCRLGPTSTYRHAKAVAELLRDWDREVRAAARAVLGGLSDAADAAFGWELAALVARYLVDASLLARQCACAVLAEMGPYAQPHLEALWACTEDRSELVRIAAHRALLHLGEAPASHLRAMTVLLQHRDWDVRVAASETLGVEAAVLNEEDGRELADLLAVYLSDRGPHTRICACEVMASLGPAAFMHTDAVSRCVEDDHAHVRTAAATAIQKIMADPEVLYM